MRKIKLIGADNARDFGGIKNYAGKTIKNHLFLRSNALHALTEEDVRILVDEYHLVQVIDLRTAEEISEKPDIKMPGVTFTVLPLLTESTIGITHDQKARNREMQLSALPDMEELYSLLVLDKTAISQLKEVFKIITAKRDGSILWHCTEGKDRCGIVSALFLSLMDVDRDLIMEDYLMTNEVSIARARLFYQQLLKQSSDQKLAEKMKRLFTAESSYLNAAFGAIDDTYGSTAVFIEKLLGIPPEIKEEFQNRCLLP